AEAEAGAFADFLGGEERLEDRLEQGGLNAGTGVGHGNGDEVAAAGGLGAERRNLIRVADADVQPALVVHGVAAVDGKIHQRGFELRDIGDRETVEIGNVDVDPDPGADQRTDQLRHRLDLGADIEYLRLQGLPAGERQQLAGQLGGALHRFANRIDVA